MFVPFEELPKTSRLWIYQSTKPFIETELKIIDDTIKQFIETWSTHGTSLLASYEIRYDRFIIIAVDTNHQAITGCSN